MSYTKEEMYLFVDASRTKLFKAINAALTDFNNETGFYASGTFDVSTCGESDNSTSIHFPIKMILKFSPY